MNQQESEKDVYLIEYNCLCEYTFYNGIYDYEITQTYTA